LGLLFFVQISSNKVAEVPTYDIIQNYIAAGGGGLYIIFSTMIIRKSVLIFLSVAPSATYAYFSQVNNAHVDFIATEELHDTHNSVETTSNRSSLQHKITSSLWNILEDALQKEKHAYLGYAAPTIMSLFENWVHQYSKEFQSIEEKGKRMLIWLENHVLIETHNAKVSSFTLGHNEFSDMTHTEFKKQMKLGEYTPELIHRDDKVFNFMEYNEENEEEEEVFSRLRGSESAVVIAEKRRNLQVPIEPPSSDKDTPTTPTITTDEKDWHHLGFMGPIRQQGTCGACWSFSSIGAIESAMAINKFNQMTPEQQSELIQSNTNNNLGLTPLSEQNLIDCDTLHEKGCAGGL